MRLKMKNGYEQIYELELMAFIEDKEQLLLISEQLKALELEE